jgi:glycosyltransferase involved in cell wall biosynthesis
MIVKNEENDLSRCLESVNGLVDEIIVVDTGSSDRTIAIAQQYGAKVISINWPGDFAEARNISVKNVSCEWILVLDADEYFDKQSVQEFKRVLTGTNATGLQLCVRNLQTPGELVKYQDNYITRVFRNIPGIFYEGMIHESVLQSIERLGGSTEKVDIILYHTGYIHNNVQGTISRSERNLALLLKMEEANPHDAYVHYQLGKTYKQLGNYSEAKIHLEKALEQANNTLSAEINNEIYMKLAQMDLSLNRENDCVKNALRSLDYAPNNKISMYLLALTYIQQGRIEEAYSYFLKIRNSPAGLLEDVQELDAVIAYCDQFIKENSQQM